MLNLYTLHASDSQYEYKRADKFKNKKILYKNMRNYVIRSVVVNNALNKWTWTMSVFICWCISG